MKNLKNIWIIVVVLLLAPACRAQLQRISLNSTGSLINWSVEPVTEHSPSGNEISLPHYRSQQVIKAVVPGVVFTSYVEAGKVPDPDYADNIHRVDETFFNRPFWYRGTFKTPEGLKSGQKVWLQFDNTNRYADFYLNGVKISGTPTSSRDVSGHMLRSKYEISGLLRPHGDNVVAVLITDADQKKTRDAKDQFGVTASPTYLSAASWDWMPYVPGRLAGITGNVSLAVTGEVTMEDPWVRSELESNDIAYLNVSCDFRNSARQPKDVVFSGVIQPGNIRFSQTVRVPAGETAKAVLDRKQVQELIIKQPRLWWPNGYGDPNLYTCTLRAEVDGELSDEREISFGIRKYEYQYARNSAGWPVLQFFINGQRIFVKGGNWGISEYLLRSRPEDYHSKIKLHKDMNYNMIRLWTGSVTDDAFYDYCDRYGIMVWDDFWLYVAYNDVASDADFKANALDKVKRLRNHASIALWCGANETHPKAELDSYLRSLIALEDRNDRMYKSSSNQDGLSGSGWWGNQPPRHHFETSASNLAWNDPPYPYGIDRGYGLRTEIGMATFPNYESVQLFIPAASQWPLPTDEQLENDNDNLYNKHYFGKEASNASPVNYKRAVNRQFGESADLETFCEKAQYLNIEVMKGMYEAWNDKMWEDASGLLLWMSQPAYPSFVWQTYDYYHDATGAYWGAKYACEPRHIQWNAATGSVKVINATSNALRGARAIARIFNMEGKELTRYAQRTVVHTAASDKVEAFRLNFNPYNLALGKPVYASTQLGERRASLATDGAEGTRWESEHADNQWISIDLGAAQPLYTLVIKWEEAYAESYGVQLSPDGKRWYSAADVQQGKGKTEEINLGGARARYVKLLAKKRGSDFGFSIHELEVYGHQRRDAELTHLHFIKLELRDSLGTSLSENFYWRNGEHELDYTGLNDLPAAQLEFSVVENGTHALQIRVQNKGKSVAFGNRLRLVDHITKKRLLPVQFTDNYFTLMPGQHKTIDIRSMGIERWDRVDILWKQYGQKEQNVLKDITIKHE
ncbi:galactose-binding domain-containing protein [Sphingobacterium suaedae]|uniref:Discoidin domain-containing protein n=1 Tax=Sphingobacterium suaedae TaxID=1686402 RepID=A0ABW5KJE2_9SPHI